MSVYCVVCGPKTLAKTPLIFLFTKVVIVKVAIDTQSIFVDGRTVPLSAGMTVSAEIKTGKRRLIEFLLSPIIKSVSEGARER